MIEKFKKDQDEHVVAGDAEVDARLEVNENRILLNRIQLLSLVYKTFSFVVVLLSFYQVSQKIYMQLSSSCGGALLPNLLFILF